MTRRRIRWARGFFRLWIAVAVLWGAVALLWTGAAVLNPYVYSPDRAYIFGLTTFPPLEAEIYSQEAFDAHAAAERGQLVRRTAKIGQNHNLSMYFPSDTAVRDINDAVAFLVGRIEAEHAQRVDKTRWSNLQAGIGWTFIPPLALLGIGVGLGWIFSGFRSAADET